MSKDYCLSGQIARLYWQEEYQQTRLYIRAFGGRAKKIILEKSKWMSPYMGKAYELRMKDDEFNHRENRKWRIDEGYDALTCFVNFYKPNLPEWF